MTIKYDEIYEKVQKYESQIQSMLGEKNVLTQQRDAYQNDITKLEEECMKKFECNLNSLAKKQEESIVEIEKLFEELEKNIKLIEN